MIQESEGGGTAPSLQPACPALTVQGTGGLPAVVHGTTAGTGSLPLARRHPCWLPLPPVPGRGEIQGEIILPRGRINVPKSYSSDSPPARPVRPTLSSLVLEVDSTFEVRHHTALYRNLWGVRAYLRELLMRCPVPKTFPRPMIKTAL